MEYAFKYWYAPLSNSFDLFLCGFLINPLLKYQTLNKSKKFNKFKWLKSSIKYISVTLLILLYFFTAHHLYHQELWGLFGRPSGWRTSTTIFLLQPLTAIITSFFIFAFESEDYHSFARNEKLSFAAILRNPFRVLEVLGTLSYGHIHLAYANHYQNYSCLYLRYPYRSIL